MFYGNSRGAEQCRFCPHKRRYWAHFDQYPPPHDIGLVENWFMEWTNLQQETEAIHETSHGLVLKWLAQETPFSHENIISLGLVSSDALEIPPDAPTRPLELPTMLTGIERLMWPKKTSSKSLKGYKAQGKVRQRPTRCHFMGSKEHISMKLSGQTNQVCNLLTGYTSHTFMHELGASGSDVDWPLMPVST